MSDAVKISFVIPCYNEAAGMHALLERCAAVLRPYGEAAEILLVDDGSTDGTWEAICRARVTDPRVRGLKLSRNFGHQMALSAGLDRSRGDRVLVLDADLQDPPELLPQMMEKMDAGADVVYGVRTRRAGVPLWKRISYKLYYRLLRLLGGGMVQLDAGDFRLLSRRVVDLVREMPETQRFMRGMIAWLGFRQEALEYRRDPRHEGKAKYTLVRLLRLAVDGIMSFSIQPLRLAVVLGSLLAALGLAGMVYIIADACYHSKTPPGWASLMVVLLLTGALQLLMTGVVGEYVGRLFIESKKRPYYIIETDTGESRGAGSR